MSIFAQDAFRDTSMIDYMDLGKIQIGLREQDPSVDLPYRKPKGITQIPSAYFNALVVHRLAVDDKEIIPVWQWAMADDSIVGKYIKEAEPEESDHSLRMYWRWARPDFTNVRIKEGIFFRTSVTGRPYLYNIPYGSRKIELLYSIRFLTYDITNRYSLVDTIESDIMGVCWEYEWILPEDEG
jgi:hypothetical protein